MAQGLVGRRNESGENILSRLPLLPSTRTKTVGVLRMIDDC